MKKRKIVVNAKVRELLAELDEVFERFDQVVSDGIAAERAGNLSKDIAYAEEKRLLEVQIKGLAHRINEASTGKDKR